MWSGLGEGCMHLGTRAGRTSRGTGHWEGEGEEVEWKQRRLKLPPSR